jgi:hypothetical protein
MNILPDLTQPSADVLAELELLREENARLKLKAAQRGNNLKITAKGGLSVYGLGRFPVTLYRSQWEKLIGLIPEVRAFIDANADKLATKED